MSQPFDNRDWDLEQLAHKSAELERLRAEHEEMLLKAAREQQIALGALENALKENEQLNVERWHLKTYASRAAEVLQLYADYPISMVMSVSLRERAEELLPELHMVAQITQ